MCIAKNDAWRGNKERIANRHWQTTSNAMLVFQPCANCGLRWKNHWTIPMVNNKTSNYVACPLVTYHLSHSGHVLLGAWNLCRLGLQNYNSVSSPKLDKQYDKGDETEIETDQVSSYRAVTGKLLHMSEERSDM